MKYKKETALQKDAVSFLYTIPSSYRSTILGIYASSGNKTSENYTDFERFEYTSNSFVYNK